MNGTIFLCRENRSGIYGNVNSETFSAVNNMFSNDSLIIRNYESVDIDSTLYPNQLRSPYRDHLSGQYGYLLIVGNIMWQSNNNVAVSIKLVKGKLNGWGTTYHLSRTHSFLFFGDRWKIGSETDQWFSSNNSINGCRITSNSSSACLQYFITRKRDTN
jgi:hypothetical protein